MKKLDKLSTRQTQVMEVFWNFDHSLTSSQISEENPGLTAPVVRASIKALLKKGYLAESEIVRTRTVFAQSYAPAISKSEYLNTLYEEFDQLADTHDNLISMVKRENDIHVLEKIEKIITEKKKELK